MKNMLIKNSIYIRKLNNKSRDFLNKMPKLIFTRSLWCRHSKS